MLWMSPLRNERPIGDLEISETGLRAQQAILLRHALQGD